MARRAGGAAGTVGARATDMIRTFAALKWRLVVNGMRAQKRPVVIAVGGTMLFLGAIGFAISTAVRARTAHTDVAFRTAGVGTYAVVFALWVFMPMLVGIDETVDPNRLALLPLSRRELRTGILTASAIGVGPAAAAIVMLGLLVGFVPFGLGVDAVLVVLGVVVAFALGITASRALATVLAQAQRSRRGRDISVVLGAVVGATLWLGVQLIGRVSGRTATRVLDALRFTPLGLPGQSIVDAANRHYAASTLELALALAWTALCGWAWMSGVSRLLVDTGASLRRERARTESDTADARTRWSRGSELQASARKELLYLARSPSRRTATLVATIFGTGFVALQLLGQHGDRPHAVVLAAPIAAVFGLNNVNNQLGFDGASLWIEVVAGGPRRAQFIGRELSWIPAIVLPSIPAAFLLAVLSGGWEYVPFAILLSIAVAGIPCGIGAVMSVFVPYPVPDATNPFANRQANTGRGCIVGLVSIGALASDAVLAIPPIVLLVLANEKGLPYIAAALVPIAAWSVLVWSAGVSIATRRVRGREPEILDAVSARRA